jgi:hypothetical protein
LWCVESSCPCTPFGGVSADIECAQFSASSGPFGVPLAAAALVDVPLPAVGDTLTLPLVFYFNIRRYDEVTQLLEKLPPSPLDAPVPPLGAAPSPTGPGGEKP